MCMNSNGHEEARKLKRVLKRKQLCPEWFYTYIYGDKPGKHQPPCDITWKDLYSVAKDLQIYKVINQIGKYHNTKESK